MIKKTTQKSMVLAAFLCCGNILSAQTQIGNDIDGETTGDRSGWAVSMPDANTVAIGAPQNDGNGGNSGQVRVYTLSGSTWTQKGADLDGEAAGDLYGSTVSMPDANTIAIGGPQNDGSSSTAGHVRVFEWDGSAWTQKGEDLDGDFSESIFGELFGSSVSMPDANTLAVGAPWDGTNGFNAGQIRVFDWDGSAWTQRGSDIYGDVASYSGSIVAMPTVNVVAFAAQGGSSGKGHVKIYEWNSSAWVQKGGTLVGEGTGDLSGSAISMPDGNTIAIGASDNDGSAAQAGHVRIYSWDGSAWVQKGNDIDGEAESDESGNAVSMPDANTVAIGAVLNDGNGSSSGHVRVYTWQESAWVQVGNDMNGEAVNDQSGYSVSMPDANTVAIGAIQNDGNGNEAGHVRVYELSTVTAVAKSSFSGEFNAFPNPTKGKISIGYDKTLENATLILRNAFGQELLRKTNVSGNSAALEINTEAGIYFLEIKDQGRQAVIKVIKE